MMSRPSQNLSLVFVVFTALFGVMFVLSALRGPAPTPRNMGVSREGQGEFSLQLEKAMREGDMLRKKIKELLKELRQEKRQKINNDTRR